MGRAMKDSGVEWIGEIPEEWNVLRGKLIFTQRSEKGNSVVTQLLTPSQKYGVVPQILYEELSGMKAVKLDSSIDLSALKTVHTGDFCISLRSFQGGFEYSEYEGVVSPAYQIFYPIKEIADGYYKRLFKSIPFIKKMNSFTMSLRDGKNIAFDDFAVTLLPYPPVLEQKQITDFLEKICDEIDTITAHTCSSIEEYKNLKQAVITQAVTKGVRGDRPMKDSGIEWIGEIPVDWKKDKVIRIFSLISSGTTPSTMDEDNFKGKVNWIQSGDINGSILYECKNKISDNTLEKYNTLTVYKAPYLILAMYGASVGNLSLSSIDACVNQACCVLCDPYIDLKFAFYSLKSAKDYLIRKAQGGGQPNINQNIVKQLWLTVPPMDEQKEIADYLDKKCAEIDVLIAQKEQLLTELENYKKSLIYEYVTGKKEVPHEH